MTYLYWIYDETCIDPKIHGYIGVTKDVNRRYKAHRRKNPDIHENTKIIVLFEGTRIECFNLEEEYRPHKGIGWNRAKGGAHGWRDEFTHSDETKSKLRDAWSDERRLKASILRKEVNKKLIGQKRPKQSESMSGEKNPMYGTTRPQHVKDAVSKAHKGKPSANKIEYYCLYCRERHSPSIINKYHGLGKKNCKYD